METEIRKFTKLNVEQYWKNEIVQLFVERVHIE